jgi:hypothetical protein
MLQDKIKEAAQANKEGIILSLANTEEMSLFSAIDDQLEKGSGTCATSGS